MLTVVFGAAVAGGIFTAGYVLGRMDGAAKHEFNQGAQKKPVNTKESRLKRAMRIRPSRS